MADPIVATDSSIRDTIILPDHAVSPHVQIGANIAELREVPVFPEVDQSVENVKRRPGDVKICLGVAIARVVHDMHECDYSGRSNSLDAQPKLEAISIPIPGQEQIASPIAEYFFICQQFQELHEASGVIIW